jgi:serine/threonine-protein kinase
MRSRCLEAGLPVAVVIALLPIALRAQQPKVQRVQAVTKDTGRVTIDPRILTGKAGGVNSAAVAAVVWRKVPGVVGRTVSLASEVIAKVGLVAKVETVTVRGRAPSPGTVVGQRPQGGDSLRLGSTVTVFVDTTRVDTARTDPTPNVTVPPRVEVPNLTGTSPGVAQETLRSKGLIAAFSPVQFADSERAKVVKQEPVAGRFVSVKSVIRLGLVVDNSTTVPDVLTLTSDLVRARVTDAQLRLAEQQAPDTVVPVGRVIAQRPQGGVRVAINSTVMVTYSSGPPLVRVPNLADSTRETAEATLARNPFRVGSVDTLNSKGGFGRVVWQEPRAASLVP